MSINSSLVVFAVFVFFGFLILSRLRKKNPKGYSNFMKRIKGFTRSPSLIKGRESAVRVIQLPDSARIM